MASSREWLAGPNFINLKRGADTRGTRFDKNNPYGDGKNRKKRFTADGPDRAKIQRPTTPHYDPKSVIKMQGEFKTKKHHT